MKESNANLQMRLDNLISFKKSSNHMNVKLKEFSTNLEMHLDNLIKS